MKKLLVCLAIIATSLTFGQELSNNEFTKEIPTTAGKSTTYDNLLIWVAESFNDANEVIKLKDKEAGIIVIKGNIKQNDYRTAFTLKLIVTDTTCKVTIKNYEELEYGYTLDSSNCYTNACKKNQDKWSKTIPMINESLVNQIVKL